MAQVIPPITSLPLDSSAAPSVEDIQDRLPSICVDYLSHDWTEEDVWASWRSMTRHKNEIANGVRLENASWRTWQKQRNKLKTISPETLNWLKDSDVTWLYGPLHTASVEPVRPLRVATADERLGLDPAAKKPILKHRTLSEMLTIHTPSSPILEASMGEDADAMDLDRPPLHQTKSDTNIVRTRGVMRKRSPPRVPNSDRNTPLEGTTPPAEPNSGTSKRHISFNTFVEQVIAVDDPTENKQNDSDDEVLEMRSSSSRSSRPSFSRNSSTTSASNGSDHLTIAKIPPTMLKTNGIVHPSLPVMVYAPPPEYVSPGLSQHSDFDFPSPQISIKSGGSGGRRWPDEDDEEDYSSVGYDYFGGPDLSGADQAGGGRPVAASPSHVGNSYGRSPVINQAPPQPKWRQAVASPGVDNSHTSSTTTTSTSSSTSLNATSPTPQPGRSILKVRQPTPAAQIPEDPPSPPSTYFNYTPSAATGFGGMRGTGAPGYDWYNPAPGAPAAQQPTSPIAPGSLDERGERGRSTSRDRGSSAYGRSSSGSASVASSSSMSPGAPTPRSPSEFSVNPQQQQQQMPQNAQSSGPVSSASAGKQTGGISQQKSQMEAAAQGKSQARSGSEDSSSKMEVDQNADADEDRRGGAGTPTPHSSPQIAFRPLKDTSPSSLPHNSTPISPYSTSSSNSNSTSTATLRSQQPSATSSAFSRAPPPSTINTPITSVSSSSHDSQRSPDFPDIDSPKAFSPTRPDQKLESPTHPSFGTISNQAQAQLQGQGYTPAVSNTPGSSRPYNVTGRATTAHVGTNAAPTLSGGFDSRAGLQNYGTAQNQGQGQGRTSPGGGSGQGQHPGQVYANAIQSAPKRYSGLGPVFAGGQKSPSAQQPTHGSKSSISSANVKATASPPAQSSSAATSYFRSNPGNNSASNRSSSSLASTTHHDNAVVGDADGLIDGAGDADGDVDIDGGVESDGSSIMGRAANIASTAKDLLGALWYGANDKEGNATGSGGMGAGGGGGSAFVRRSASGNAGKGGHKRGQSIG